MREHSSEQSTTKKGHKMKTTQNEQRSHVNTNKKRMSRVRLLPPKARLLVNPNSGRELPNAIIITTNAGTFLQSYNHTIVAITYKGIFLDKRYYASSTTTSRHRNIFLGVTNDEFYRRLNAGKYVFTALNHHNRTA